MDWANGLKKPALGTYQPLQIPARLSLAQLSIISIKMIGAPMSILIVIYTFTIHVLNTNGKVAILNYNYHYPGNTLWDKKKTSNDIREQLGIFNINHKLTQYKSASVVSG